MIALFLLTLTHLAEFAASAPASEGVSLRHAAPVGRVGLYDISTTTELTTADVKGPGVSAETTLTLRCRVEVVDADDESFSVHVRWTGATGTLEVPLFGTVTFDSAWDKLDQQSEEGLAGSIRSPWLGLVGTEYEARIDPAGNVLEMPDLDRRLQEVRERVETGPNDGMVEALLTEPALRAQLGMLFPVFPNDPVEVRDSWSSTLREQIGNSQSLTVESDNDCTLSHFDDKRATVRIDSRVVRVGHAALDFGWRQQAYTVDPVDGLPLSGVVTTEFSKTRRHWIRGATRSSMAVQATLARVDDTKKR